MTHPATELRTGLSVAAKAAYLGGATTQQIDHIVALARGARRYDIAPGGRLTNRDARMIIDAMLAEGIEADWNVAEEELDHQDHAISSATERAAFVKARKTQKSAEKKQREAAGLALLSQGSDGRKVRHKRFGVGSVIEEDDTTFTAKFSVRREPMKIAKTALEMIE